ncbi:MAG TPA: bifunctional ADP-heptose synthase [bacterium]|jgi:rfaE bifunctional protein kinase chain/domain|nr:bifunctional ADP-heptose synthase [bacterium]
MSPKDLKQARAVLERFDRLRVVVLGDLVLDEYVFGETTRISREAPVLILKHERTLSLPGGGANPVSNIASLGASALPVGVLGLDRAADTLLGIFKDKGVDSSGVLSRPGRVSPLKIRILAGGHNTARQQVIRVDHEAEDPIDAATETAVLKALEERLAGAHALIISDYGNGLITPRVLKHINALAKRRPKLVICVDSRYQLGDYRGVSVITPNETEAAPAAGFEDYRAQDLDEIGRKLLQRTKARMVLVTRGSRGMSLFRPRRRDDVPVCGPTEPVDVNGAGDSVASCITLALAAGADPLMAMRLANAAGGVAVMQRGPASVTREQILTLLEQTGL